MLFMVIETFRPGCAAQVYQRLEERGRSMPDGLRYVDSWIQADLRRCFQLMECDDPALFQRWIAAWSDLMEFEILPVAGSAETRSALRGS